MKLNYRPASVCFIDFETQSQCDLSKTTSHKYANHPTTRILTCVAKVDGVVHRFGPYLDAEAKQKLVNIATARTLVAHNAPFDAAVWEAAGLGEVEWFDTLPCARAAGFPGGLDDVGRLLTGRGKDPNGRRLVDMLCILRTPKAPAIGPAHQLLMDYNQRDVELLEEVYAKVALFGEPDVMVVDRAINNRGLPADRGVLEKLVDLYAQNKVIRGAEFAELTEGKNPNSAKQVKDWMRSIGFEVPIIAGKESINRWAVRELMDNPDEFFTGDGELDEALDVLRDALAARREVTRVGKSKVETAIQVLESDGRVRDQLVYYGAHTGRWSGRALQPHNLPSSRDTAGAADYTYEACVAEADRASAELKRRVAVADVLGAMIRSMVRSDNLLVADYGAVEARGAAWLAEESRMLALFADPTKSAYIDMGEQVFGRRISKKDDPEEYTLAKTLVLGCSYGMSGPKFAASCKALGVSLAALEKAGVDVKHVVRVYRNTYPAIPKLWNAYHEAIHAAVVDGVSTFAGKCHFRRVGPDMHVVLPSGRPIVYRNVRIEMLVPGYCKLYNMEAREVPTVVFDLPRMYGDRCKRGFLYGSKVCENITQGVCRDLLADAICRCEQLGLDPVLHVHDEVMCEAPPTKFADFMEVMSTGPAWASGFPILAEGYSGPVWTKRPGADYIQAEYLGGRNVHS